ESSYRQGKFPESMQTSMKPEDFVCLGAFRLKDYKPGQQLTLIRNPHFWKKDNSGQRLPYVEEIIFLLFTDLDHLQLSIEKGKIDTYYNIRAQDVDALSAKAVALNLNVLNLGPAFECEQMFFNLNGGTNPKTGKPYVAPVKRSWFENLNFRRAVSCAIDRDSLVRMALFGKGVPAYGLESSANKIWYNDRIRKYRYDPQQALQLLRDAGFIQKVETSGKQALYDKSGNLVRFSLYTNAGNTIRNSQCNLIASDLAKLGITVDYSPVQFNALVDKVTASFDYDAVLLALSHDDIDPSGGMNILLSSGSLHFWWPLQELPQTAWEKRIDELMMQQLVTFDLTQRKKLYDEVQEIIAEQQPIIFTVTQYVYVSARKGIGNLQPTIARHRTLWNADELFWQ
ncbi:MAG TPA: ABC transporter substrate-binding protein, partial [Acidobacteriota bacterium]